MKLLIPGTRAYREAIAATQRLAELERDAAISKEVQVRLKREMPKLEQQALARSMTSLVGAADSARPIAFEQPWLYGNAFTHSSKRKPKSIVTTDTLRQFADNCDILRDCIEHLKREARAVQIKVAPRDENDDTPATQRDVEEATEFFGRNGGLGGVGRSRRHFEAEIFEEAFVIGAHATYVRPTRGGGVYSAVSLQADTIVPLVDDHGWVNPEMAFRQVIDGVQRGQPYSITEIIYDGFHPISNSPYFKSRVEYLIAVIMAALKADEWNLTWLTDGNSPDSMISCPEHWSPSQIIEYANYFDEILAGDGGMMGRRKMKIVPGGTQVVLPQSRKEADFQEFERWLMYRTCAMFGTHPSAIGFSSDTYKFSQEAGAQSTSQFGANDLLELRKDLYDHLLEQMGFPHLEIRNVTEGEESPMERVQRLKIELGGKAWKSVNEARIEVGLKPAPDEGANEVVPEPVENEPEPGKKGNSDEKQRLSDLRKWQRKSLSRLAGGQASACEFASEVIGDEARSIIDGLKQAESADAVRAVFAPYLGS